MSSKAPYIKWFRETTIKDIPSVGGKNASLGEMFRNLTKKGIAIPNGFAITAAGYRKFLEQNDLEKKIKIALKGVDATDVKKLSLAGKKIREMILKAEMPWEISREILHAYRELTIKAGKKVLSVAVRSSATAEDLPEASFAGQQETYLNVIGDRAVLLAVKKCMASLFTDRAISYRIDKGFDHLVVALSVCVQEMVGSDIGESGVIFTLYTESGFTGVVLVSAT